MILILKREGDLFKVVAEYEDDKACEADLGSPEFLTSRPELENQEILVADILIEKTLVDQRLEKARALLKKGKMKKADIDFVLGLAEPEVGPTAKEGVKILEIPEGWQTAGITQLRKYAKIACPDTKVGRWTKDACIMAVNKYLQAQREAHVTDLLPLPEEKAEPAPTTAPPVPPAPPAIVGAPQTVPPPGAAAPTVVPPVPTIVPPKTNKSSGAIPAPPPPLG